MNPQSAIRNPQSPPSLSADLAEDLAKLAAYFSHGHTLFISEYLVGVMGLHLSARALVNLGALVPRTLGRWNDGYGPGPVMKELEAA